MASEPGAEASPPTPTEPRSRDDVTRTLVVGLGASAGGVAALGSFVEALAHVDDLILIVVQHLSPDHGSDLARILSRSTEVPVSQVTETTRVQAGRVYVIPPGKDLEIANDVLRPVDTNAERASHAPVDHFFRTLASAYGRRAVGILLSGTGHDGVDGARRIHEEGGIVLAQSADEAAFDGMPSAVARAGLADVVAPVHELARNVLAYRGRADRRQAMGGAGELDDPELLGHVFRHLRSATGHDFSHYKRPTVLRRLERRMHVAGTDGLAEYLDYLRAHDDEPAKLQRDLLIAVTQFFRDPDAFAVLEREVVPALFEGKGPDDEIRVWVPGCATGEEAYSIAMLLVEQAHRRGDAPALQVFASDLSDTRLQIAREGSYSPVITADVSEARLRRFFRHDGDGYRVVDVLRDVVLFAPHNLIKDPPFSKLDLISCRNMLIYMQRPLQDRVLELFHYALRRGGHLFLGTSETTDGASRLFAAVDKRMRIYRREDVPSALPEFVVPTLAGAGRGRNVRAEPERDDPAGGHGDLHESLRAKAAPPSLLIGRNREVVHISDEAAPFLGFQSGGGFTQDAAKLIAPELQLELRTGLHRALRRGVESVGQPVRVDVRGVHRSVRLVIRPVHTARPTRDTADPTFALVLFEGVPEGSAPRGDGGPGGAGIDALERQIVHLEDQLKVVVEEYETQHEEYKAAIEELQSMNEELRSTAEELETSREEAQSTSEELRTVNDEVKENVGELRRAHGHVENLLVSSEIATLFLDRELRLWTATPLMEDLFGIGEPDTGRALRGLARRLPGADLEADARRVLRTLAPIERERDMPDGRTFLTRLGAYRSLDDKIEGVVVTFVDVTRRTRAEAELEQLNAKLERRVLDRADRARRRGLPFDRTFRLEGPRRRAGPPESGRLVADGLTPREREVLSHVARGVEDEEIARTLGLARSTIRTYVNRILAKLGVDTRAEAIRWSREHGRAERPS